MANDRLQDAQYFKSNQALLPAGPARTAELAAVDNRRRVYQQAVAASREVKDALLMCQQLDKTGNFDGGLDHALRVWVRLNQVMEKFRVQGITFLADFDEVDDAA